jgi:hypothetical protein
MPLGEFKNCNQCGEIFSDSRDNDTCPDCLEQPVSDRNRDRYHRQYIQYIAEIVSVARD